MLQSLVVLMFFQFLGELLVHATGLPLPGPVCGMLFLLAWLRSGWTLPVELTGVATGLLDHFGLLFVPAGVSVIGFGALIVVATVRRSCWRSCCRSQRPWPSPPAPSAGVRRPNVRPARGVSHDGVCQACRPAAGPSGLAAGDARHLCRRHRAVAPPRQGADPQSHDAEHHRDRRRADAVGDVLSGLSGWRCHPELRAGYGGGGACRPAAWPHPSTAGTNAQARRGPVRGLGHRA